MVKFDVSWQSEHLSVCGTVSGQEVDNNDSLQAPSLLHHHQLLRLPRLLLLLLLHVRLEEIGEAREKVKGRRGREV